MSTFTRLSLLLSPLLIAACAAPAPRVTEFPAGARTPSAAELGTLLRGKSTSAPMPDGSTIRVDYTAGSNDLTVFAAGRSDTGTWRAEDGKVCYDLKTFRSTCTEIRLVGQQMYGKRASGEVVPVTIGR